MVQFFVTVLDINNLPLSNKTVKACKQGFDKSCYESTTNQSGTAEFNITAWNETIEVSVEGLTTGRNTVNVDFFGNVQPDHLTITTSFKPLDNVGKTLNSFADYLKGLGTIGVVVIAIVIAVILFIVVRKAVTGGTMPSLPSLPR